MLIGFRFVHVGADPAESHAEIAAATQGMIFFFFNPHQGYVFTNP